MNINELISKMTLEEKASLCSGANVWQTKAIERLNIPSIMMTDGPHGLRKQDGSADHLGLSASIPSTCFPAASATACSFDKELISEMGKALGQECLAEEVSIILGPGTNIKRSPLCGRNFEYFSEDPYLSSEMAKAHINGVQSMGVGTSLKHFAANNQETRRMSVDAVVDERALREIYLASFESAVKEAEPWTVMCSYNKLNGTYASENKWLLTDVLRDEWGFEGFVVSDWGAVNDRVNSLVAGMDLEMPYSGGYNDAQIVKAVKDGLISEETIDIAVERLLKIILTADSNKKETSYDIEAHNNLAIKIAAESMVLLKNDGILPLSQDKKVAFIGEFFEKPRYQGGGSSHINPHKVTSGLDYIDKFANTKYAKGFELDKEDIDKQLFDEALNLASESDICVIFAGLPDKFESEGFDRTHMDLPQNQNELISKIANVQPNTVVVLHNGSPVSMPWINDVKGILEAYLGGQAIGAAVMETLYGLRNPSGKLAETFPKRLEDTPSFINFPGTGDNVEYREGIFVGYRYYDKVKADVLFPFGHGLSYTSFEYSNISADNEDIFDKDIVNISLNIKNTGTVKGKEVVQLYVSLQNSEIIRPVKELKGFEKIELEPGEEKTITFTLDKRAFAYYSTEINDWHVETGSYLICIGKSSRDILLTKTVHVKSTDEIQKTFTVNSTVGDLMKTEKGRELIQTLMKNMPMVQNMEQSEGMSDMFKAMMVSIPLRAITMFSGGAISLESLKALLKNLQ